MAIRDFYRALRRAVHRAGPRWVSGRRPDEALQRESMNKGDVNSEDLAWVDAAVRTLRVATPRIGSGALKAQSVRARELVAATPAARRPGLIVALFELYPARKDKDFLELMFLVEALYGALPELSEDQACAILAATRHSCGHGGVEEPIDLAMETFGNRPYTPPFFDALRIYRERLAHIRSAEVTRARGKIALLLWQDVAEPLRPRSCLSRGIREGYLALPETERGRWAQMLRHVDRTARRRPDRKWILAATPALAAVGGAAFAGALRSWLRLENVEEPVALSTGGRHVLKTLIWLAGLAQTDQLDELLPRLIDLPYAKPKAAVHLVYAVGYWLESRPPALAGRHRSRLREKWPLAGQRIRG